MASLVSNSVVLVAFLPCAMLTHMCTNLSNVPGFKSGFSLRARTMRVHKDKGVFRCFYSCQEVMSCMSFSYDVTGGECHMFGMAGSADTLVQKDNHVFANVKSAGPKNDSTIIREENTGNLVGDVIRDDTASNKKQEGGRMRSEQTMSRSRINTTAGNTRSDQMRSKQTTSRNRSRTTAGKTVVSTTQKDMKQGTQKSTASGLPTVFNLLGTPIKHQTRSKQEENHPEQHLQVDDQTRRATTEKNGKDAVDAKPQQPTSAPGKAAQNPFGLIFGKRGKSAVNVKKQVAKKKKGKVVKEKKKKRAKEKKKEKAFSWGGLGAHLLEKSG